MNRSVLVLVLCAAVIGTLLSACTPPSAQGAVAQIPVDKAYAEGKGVYFMHPEVSNEGFAQKMTAGMKSPVLYVPSLGAVPQEALANVYVFTNGVKGASMSGLQPSIFDSPPGTAGYTPLRRLNLVSWTDESKARELTSAAEVLAAVQARQVAVKQPGVVINMPFVVWDGGKR